jgi:hypothetical protein
VRSVSTPNEIWGFMIDSKSRALKERSLLKRQFLFDTDHAFSTLGHLSHLYYPELHSGLLQDVPLAL